MKFFNPAIWIRVFGALALVSGSVNALAAESIAPDFWDAMDGNAIDIAQGLEIAWGVHLAVWGASILVISLLMRGSALARFGAISVLAVNLAQMVSAGALSNLGYQAGFDGPGALIGVAVISVSLITLVACLRNWNVAANAESAPAPAM